ncbi:hypothetical protein LUZ60_016798 [Juncus effusus]|nr:hypothetical protein LUZ60_016798 [Juncus effusus]
MEVNFLYCSVLSTALSFVGLQWWAGTIKVDGKDWIGIVLGSSFNLILVVNFGINLFFLLLVCLKSVFFETLHASESRKIAERTVNYLLYKGAPLALVVPSNVSQFFIWPSWLVIITSLKIFESMARDRLERLNASPSVTPLKYLRVYSALLFVLFTDLFWMKLCLLIYKSYNSSLFLLLFFEPLSIAFETLQGIMVYGFQLFEIWRQHLLDKGDDCFIFSFLRGLGCKKTNQLITNWIEKVTVSELRGVLVRNLGFVLDMGSLLMSLNHYLTIICLRGISFHFADVFLLMNLRQGLLSAIFMRVKTFIKLRKALNSLDKSLSDASYEEICAFNDECAICRGAMCRAKKLSCNHLFHLACLRSWLDQGFTEIYSCPTCRRPLFLSNQTQRSEQTPVHPNPRSSPFLRGAGLDQGWIPPAWQSNNNQSDAASSSTSSNPLNPLGLSGVQMMMRQLTSATDTNLPHNNANNPSSSSSSGPYSGLRNDRNALGSGLRIRSNNNINNNNSSRRSGAEMLSMVSRVREVLPHVHEELIIQDLLRTNNINITVNNLLVQ